MMHGGARAEKQRIRQEARIISGQMTPEYRQEASRAITRQVLELPFWKEAGTVMAYWSMPSEPDTRELMETALREGKTLLLPRCLDATRMAALPVSDPDTLEKGTSGSGWSEAKATLRVTILYIYYLSVIIVIYIRPQKTGTASCPCPFLCHSSSSGMASINRLRAVSASNPCIGLFGVTTTSATSL